MEIAGLRREAGTGMVDGFPKLLYQQTDTTRLRFFVELLNSTVLETCLFSLGPALDTASCDVLLHGRTVTTSCFEWPGRRSKVSTRKT